MRYWVDGWSVASWLLTPGDHTYVTDSIPVAVGQVLTGVMTQTKQSSTSYSLTAAFAGIAGTTLSGTYTAPLTDAYASALETYGTKTHSMDYPAGTLTFSNIALKFAGTAPAVAYTVLDYQPSIGTTSITTNGARGAKTVIHEPPVFQLMKFCTDVNFTGSCDTVTYPSAASVPLASDAVDCINLEAPFLNSIASARIIPSGADYACYLYRCGFFFWKIINPSHQELTWLNRNTDCVTPRLRIDASYSNLQSVAFNDIALSWSCNHK
jgi:hypothetical protein